MNITTVNDEHPIPASPLSTSRANKLKAADQAAQQQNPDRSGDVVQACPLLQRFAIEALLLTEDDKPLADIAVELRKSASAMARGKTGTDGVARFESLEAGSYELGLYELDKDAWALIDIAALPAAKAKSSGDMTWIAPPPAVNQEFSHRVVQGECTSKLAAQYGFLPETVWDFQANAALKASRASMNILNPNEDSLTFPAKRLRQLRVDAGMQCVLRRKEVPSNLSIRFLDENGEPRGMQKYLIKLSTGDDAVLADRIGTLDEDGFLKETVLPAVTAAEVTITTEDYEHIYEIAIGKIDPIDTDTGVLRRLRNLGFFQDETDTETNEWAIAAFQQKHELKVTGVIDSATRSALETVFRS